MITNNGKAVINKFFAGQVPQIAGSIALGTGTTAAAVTDTALATEVVRLPIVSINADIENSAVVFKAVVQPGQIATIKEVALYSSELLGTGQSPLDGSNVLVARTVIPEVTTDPNVPSEIEYVLEINIT